MQQKTLLLLFFLICGTLLHAQRASVAGTLRDAKTDAPLAEVQVQLADYQIVTTTNKNGQFRLDDLPAGEQLLIFKRADLETTRVPVKLVNDELLVLNLVPWRVFDLHPQTEIPTTATEKKTETTPETAEENPITEQPIVTQSTTQTTDLGGIREEMIPTISLNDSELDDPTGNENVSALLTASRDPFLSAAAFNWSAMRFRIRGYDSNNTDVFLNGINMNNPETGRVFWSLWGGLNDVFRNRDTKIGLAASDYAVGGVGGVTMADIRASTQRAQTRVSYSSANRSYRHRVMATHSTGLNEKGWALTVSASRRWAEEGYQPGTFYDAYSYFLGIEKQFDNGHSLSFTALGAPNRRGRSGASTQEVYDLTGTNYYNPFWGFQMGEKRNSRVADSHQPLGILQHVWKINDKSTLQTAASYQFGEYGASRLNWNDAPDPRADFYRNLPSYYDENGEIGDELAVDFQNNPDRLQLQWEQFYEVNRNNLDRIENVNGEAGNTVEGARSQYILEEQHFDNKIANFSTNLQSKVNDNFVFNIGINATHFRQENYREVKDLLGGDFWLDVDRFAERDFPDNPAALQSDLENPNRVVTEGERFGYNYTTNLQRAKVWAQGQWTYNKFDFFAAADLTSTTFWREGLYRNGRFPENSLGESAKQNFTNYATKAGLTYKINGRQYVYANATYRTRAPFLRNAYVSPRTRNQLVPNLTEETIYGGEAGYYFRSPQIKGRATAYFTQFENQTNIIRFYNDFDRAFGNYILTGINQQHLGLEFSLEAKLTSALSLEAAAAVGQYTYNSRPEALVVLDNATGGSIDESAAFTIYQDNYYVPSTPQSAYSVGLNYRSPQFWFVDLTANYMDNSFLSFSPDRRRADAVFGITDAAELQTIIGQEPFPNAFTLDFFGGKSFKFGDYFLYLTLGVSNILDNQNMRSGGFEQLRFDTRNRDVNTFPNRYYYALGRNYFANISFKF